MRIRTATRDDIEAIVGFTTDTFEWGDYVPSMIGTWVDDDDGAVLVAVDDQDTPVGLTRGVFLTEGEVWLHAIRIHPDHRGRGVAGELNDALTAWATEAGGRVIRVLIEGDNVASIRHFTKQGFRQTVSVVRAARTVGAASPNPEGNGGLRRPSTLTAKPGKAQDLVLVRSAWSTSDVGRSMRQLIATGWQFHWLTDADIQDAAGAGHLWEIGNSWAITGSIEPLFEVRLLDTSPDEGHDALRALIDTANNRGAEEFTVWIPEIDWLVRAARRAGCDVERYGIWERPL